MHLFHLESLRKLNSNEAVLFSHLKVRHLSSKTKLYSCSYNLQKMLNVDILMLILVINVTVLI